MQTYEMLLVAPVPVGHRVELRWYRKLVTGLLSGQRYESTPNHPFVRDLDTGVVYGDHDLFLRHGAVVQVSVDKPTPLEWDPLPEHQLEYQVVGRVVGCRVSTFRIGQTFHVQSTLVVEPQG
jgi:hypothetical protein